MLQGAELRLFPVVREPRGNLGIIEGGIDIPFDILRVYYLYDIPAGADRGGHAHRTLKQTLIALSGSFDVHLDNGNEQETITLNRPNKGLLLSHLMWRTIDNFTSGAVCLVLASGHYDEEEYIRDYDEFLRVVRRGE